MKTKLTVTELSHEDLVNLFSTATYDNDLIHVEVAEDEESLSLAEKAIESATESNDCREDVWAYVLLHGGRLEISDMADESEEPEDETQVKYYGKEGINWLSTRYKPFTVVTREIVFGLDLCEHSFKAPAYTVNLENILNGFNNPKASPYVHDIMEEADDLYTNYNVIQIAVFGDIIYG